MKGRGVVAMHRENTRGHLKTLMRDCCFNRLADLNRDALEQWLSREATADRSARSRNAHRAAIIAFANWCTAVGRLSMSTIVWSWFSRSPDDDASLHPYPALAGFSIRPRG
jgi:hypothetical protein